MSRRPLAVGLAGLALTAAACTSSVVGSGGSTPVSPPSSSAVVSSPVPSSSAVAAPSAASTSPSSAPATTHTRSPRPTDSATTSSSTPPPTTPPPPSGPQPCTAAQLTVTGVRGGAFQGQEVAGLLYTNSSLTACTLSGYPFAQLHYRGRALGKPAKDNPGTVRTILVRPGKSAQTQLTAITTCQAPISDTVVEVAPATHDARSVPMQLRGCSLSVDPIEAG